VTTDKYARYATIDSTNRNRRAGIFFAALLGLIGTGNTFAADSLFSTPLFRKFGVEDGLPATRTSKLAEDRDGFLWVGTRDGLARYDGSGFRVWRHDSAKPESLSGNSVSALYVDRANRVWVSADDGGVNLLDNARDGFRHFHHDADVASLADNDVWAIAQDSGDDTMWFGTASTGLDHQLANGRFAHLRHDDADANSVSSDTVLSLYFDARGRLWIGTDKGVDLRERDGTFRHVDFAATATLQARSISAEKDGSVLLGSDQGVWRIDTDLHARQELSSTLPSLSTFATQRDAQGDLWIGTKLGLSRLQSDGTLATYAPNPALAGSLPGNRVFDMLRDHENGLWFALTDGGLAHLPPQWRNFTLFRADPSSAHSLSGNNFVGLGTDAQHGVWTVSVNGGADRLDAQNGKVEHASERLPVGDLRPLSVLADQQHQLWIGHRAGLGIFDLDKNTLQALPLDAKRDDALMPGVFNILLACPEQTIWASARGGALHRIDAKTHAITRFVVGASGLASVDITALRCDAQAKLWLAHAEGLQFFDAASQQFVSPKGAPSQRVHALSFAADGTLWLHTLGALERFRVDASGLKSLQRIDAADGWPAVEAGGMVIDTTGQLWVSSARGLFRIDPQSRAIRQFDIRDGLISTEFADGAFVQTPQGILFAANLAGIVAFDPRKFDTNPIAPPLVWGDISISRDAQRLALPGTDSKIELNWNDRDLRVEAHALSFANPPGNRYQFQLAGYDSTWVDNGSRGVREFGQLSAGKYQLQIRAANADGVWSASSKPLQIDVKRAPWLTPFAYAVYALIGLLFLLAAFLSYRRRVQLRHQFALAEQQRHWAEQASAAKSGFLANMGHEIRTPMTGVLGMTELLLRTPLDARQRGYAETIAQSGSLMLRLVNDALDLARIEAGKLELESKPFDLPALLREVHALEQPLALQKNLGFDLRIAPDAARLVSGDVLRVKQILLNLCNNALKFCEHGSVGISLARAADDSVLLSVHDTGPGISAELRERLFQRFEQADGGITQRYGGSGLGLAICRELVECMRGTISVESALGVGTTFTVCLPLPQVAAENTDSAIPPSASTVATVVNETTFVASLRVLLVEDDATIARVIVGLLEAQGHRVRHAPHGLAALAELERGDIDRVLLDLDLPGIDGFQFARLLRERERSNNTPRLFVIAITARSGGDEEQRTRDAGMDGFLRKPISGAQLADALDAASKDGNQCG